jgi:hypothetical protein
VISFVRVWVCVVVCVDMRVWACVWVSVLWCVCVGVAECEVRMCRCVWLSEDVWVCV